MRLENILPFPLYLLLPCLLLPTTLLASPQSLENQLNTLFQTEPSLQTMQKEWKTQKKNMCRDEADKETCIAIRYGKEIATALFILKKDNATKLTNICANAGKRYYDSGITAQMRHGAVVHFSCLKGVILAIGENKIEFSDNAHNWNKMVDDAGGAIGALYWTVYNERKSCNGFCGTMYQLFHNGKVVEFYKKLINDLYEAEA